MVKLIFQSDWSLLLLLFKLYIDVFSRVNLSKRDMVVPSLASSFSSREVSSLPFNSKSNLPFNETNVRSSQEIKNAKGRTDGETLWDSSSVWLFLPLQYMYSRGDLAMCHLILLRSAWLCLLLSNFSKTREVWAMGQIKNILSCWLDQERNSAA